MTDASASVAFPPLLLDGAPLEVCFTLAEPSLAGASCSAVGGGAEPTVPEVSSGALETEAVRPVVEACSSALEVESKVDCVSRGVSRREPEEDLAFLSLLSLGFELLSLEGFALEGLLLDMKDSMAATGRCFKE